jgi:hypothetical protein
MADSNLGGGNQFRRLPQLGGDGHCRCLVGGQFDGRQRIRLAVDAVTLDWIERRHLAGLQRNA